MEMYLMDFFAYSKFEKWSFKNNYQEKFKRRTISQRKRRKQNKK